MLRDGWRRSANRTRLRANSLQTGNFTGKFAVSEISNTVVYRKTAVLQSLPDKFMQKLTGKKIWANRAPSQQEQGIPSKRYVFGSLQTPRAAFE